MHNEWRVAWYRLRATFRRRWADYLNVVLLVGLIGGVGLASLAGARRTQSAFPTYLAASDASNLQADVWNLQESLTGPATTNIAARLARLPDVAHVASAPTMIVVPLRANGTPTATAPAVYDNLINIVGSVGGMYFRRDHVGVTSGRLADPNQADQIDATALAARTLGWRVGQTVVLGAFTPGQVQSPNFNPSSSSAYTQVSVKLVGLVAFTSAVAHDDVDRYPTQVLITPALTRRLQRSETLPLYGLSLRGGNRSVAVVEREIIRSVPRGTVYAFHETPVVVGQVQRASKPEAFALGAFGVLAMLAALVIGGLAISRRLWVDREDMERLRALGADRATTTLDATLGIIGAVVVGALGALGVATLLSPLAPLGPIRQVEPSFGFAFDGTVLWAGLALLVLGLGGAAVVLARRLAVPGRGRRSVRDRGLGLVGAAARAGLAVAALTRQRFALQRGHGRSAVPVRSVLVGAVLAVTVVATTLTFGSGLSTLNSHPALYGWNWNLAIETGAGGSVPPSAVRLLAHDRDVAAWTGFNFGDVQFDGLTVPVLQGDPRAPITPPILTGHALDATDQVVLGAATLAQLHKKVGDTVYLSYGSPAHRPVYVPPTPLVIVGTATMPAVGTSGTYHPSMGVGALFANDVGPPAFQRAIASPDPNLNGPSIMVVRLKKGVSARAGRASVQRIVVQLNRLLTADPRSQGDTTFVVGDQRPSEIVAYQSTGAAPALLASGLVAGVVVALGLTLTSSVRRRRRDLAMLKTLGFTRRQLLAVIAWQATVTAVVGVVVGIPLGVVLGRDLWTLFARSIN
ncbi:MAG: FtsX-like permease family protein, partial [Acidimicrobiales bacterium]